VLEECARLDNVAARRTLQRRPCTEQ
jgi:hypothetical protein